MARVVHFEIHADDPERAIDFYESALGWEFTKWDGPGEYWLIKTGSQDEPGINGGLMRRQGPLSGDEVNAFVCTVQVESIEDTASKVEESGGTVSIPKFSVPGVGWVAYFKDTEGNTFGALEPLEQTEAH
ncbi:MAG: VOC family protein [Candidatus Dadabacteria bacterium]|nr:VOC family protein [Candidatus Dadabacteria bacterium]